MPQEALATIDRYGENPANFLKLFAPNKQVEYSKAIDRCFFGHAPSLATLSKAYGENVAESWLEIQVNDLSEFAGAKDKVLPHQSEELAKLIKQTYGHYKATEIMLFFYRYKRGDYGTFYGSVDPLKIMGALSEFNAERARAHTKRENERIRAEQEVRSQKCVTWEEYKRLKSSQ